MITHSKRYLALNNNWDGNLIIIIIIIIRRRRRIRIRIRRRRRRRRSTVSSFSGLPSD